MNIVFLLLFFFVTSPLCAAEIEHVTKGVILKKDPKKKHELIPLLQQKSWINEVNKFPLDIKKIICRNVKMMIIEDLNIDRKSFLDANKKYEKDWNKVKLSSLLWHYHAVQHYMAKNGYLTIGSKVLSIHDALQLSSEQRNLMIKASKSSGSPLFYWDYVKLEKIPVHITDGMTVTINQPTFFDKFCKVGSIQCYQGSIIVEGLCGLGTFITSILGCVTGCNMVPAGVVAVTFSAGVVGYTVVACCCCVGRKTEDFKKDA